MNGFFRICVFFVCLLGAACSSDKDEEKDTSTGPMVSDLDGKEVLPLQRPAEEKAVVFIFLRTDCPIGNRYAPEMRRIMEKYSPLGIGFALVYPDATESAQAIRTHVSEYGLEGVPVFRDPGRNLVRYVKATITPEAAVYLPGGLMVYRGRIDDRFVEFGRTRPAPTRHDLDQVLSKVSAGENVEPSTTTAVGCYIE